MLRELDYPALSWSDKTMTVIKERQMEAWENRLMAFPKGNIFAEKLPVHVTQGLWEKSYDGMEGYYQKEMMDVDIIKETLVARMAKEVHFLSSQEHVLIERLLIQDGKTELFDWEEAGAAESLVKRLWCNVEIEGETVVLYLPQFLHGVIADAMDTKEHKELRDKVFRFGATIHGLLYIIGFLPIEEPLERFLSDVSYGDEILLRNFAKRYFMAAFDYMINPQGNIVLVHPGLAEIDRVMNQKGKSGVDILELAPETMLGAMNGILPEEVTLHREMVGNLFGKVRPEYNPIEVAEDLRLLAKQKVPFEEMTQVLQSTLAGYPTKDTVKALASLVSFTPSWYGLKTTVSH